MKRILPSWIWLAVPMALATVDTRHVLAADLPNIVVKANQVTGTNAIESVVTKLAAEKDVKDQIKAAATLVKEKQTPFTVNALLVLAQLAQTTKQYEEGAGFLRAYITKSVELKSPAKILLGYSNLIEFLFQARKYADCEKTCREFLEFQYEGEEEEATTINRAKAEYLRVMIQCQARQGDGSRALTTLDRLLQQDPSDLDNGFLKARILHLVGKEEESIELYEELIPKVLGLEKVKKEIREGFAARMRYSLSSVYIDVKKTDKAIGILKDLVEKYPENPTYNNDLGYVMADNNKDLDEAEKLIRKALDLERAIRKKLKLQGNDDKDNASYLDSLGWVLFKKGKLEEAKKALEEAVKQEEGQQSSEILDHYAEVQVALKQKPEAVKLWQKALDLEAVTKRDKAKRVEIEKKLKAG